MSIFEYLDDIRKRPLEERNRFAVVASLLITSLVIIIWIFNLSLPDVSSVGKVSQTTADTQAAPGLLDSIKTGFYVILDGIGSGINSIIDYLR